MSVGNDCGTTVRYYQEVLVQRHDNGRAINKDDQMLTLDHH